MIIEIILTGIGCFAFMEFVAWSNHKYVMHGFLWSLHRDHHTTDMAGKPELQKNDLFFLIYAIPAIILIIWGLSAGNPLMISAGAGITLYGIVYFVFHDIVYHKRLPLFRNPKSRYVKALIRAHDAHHQPKNRTDFNNFGLLLFSKRYFN